MKRKNWRLWRTKAINLQQTRESLQKSLGKVSDETPANTSLVLLSHILKQSKSWLLAHGEYRLTPGEKDRLETSLARLLAGTPLPYILGYWEFYGQTFLVDPAVLIPRPETELLVETALEIARQQGNQTIVDIGTGSGVIAITLAAELPDATIIATDISRAALKIAQKNAFQLNQHRIHFVQSHLILPIKSQLNLICANLPYLPSRSLDTLSVAKSEPRLALDGGENGLTLIRMVLKQARSRLRANGTLLLEIDASQGEPAMRAAKRAFPEADHHLLNDLAGRDRLLVIQNISG